MSSFLANLAKIDQKSTFFGEKWPKNKFFRWYWLRRQARENFKVFRAIIPSQSTNFYPKFCTWLELGGGQDHPHPPSIRA